MEWEISGIWGDENMPDVELLRSELFGTRISPVIDTTEAIEELGEIRSGNMSWRANFPKYSVLDIEYSLDGGETYQKPLGEKRFLIGVSNNMQLKIRINLRSAVVDILPYEALELYEVVIRLSDEPFDEFWDDGERTILGWNPKEV